MKSFMVGILGVFLCFSAVSEDLISEGTYAFDKAVCQNGEELSLSSNRYQITKNDLIVSDGMIRNEVTMKMSGTTCEAMGEGEITYKDHTFFDEALGKIVTEKVAEYEIIVPSNGCSCFPLDAFCRFIIPQVQQGKHLASVKFGVKTETDEATGEDVEVEDMDQVQITHILEYEMNEDNELVLDADGNKKEVEGDYNDSRRQYCEKKESDLPPTYSFIK